MSLRKGIWIPIIWWQTESVTRETPIELKQWTFSPVGLAKIGGWVLTYYTLSIPCSLNRWHIKSQWDHVFAESGGEGPPEIPKDVWRELRQKTKNIKKSDPWPGRD
jgi:hypothetical protein